MSLWLRRFAVVWGSALFIALILVVFHSSLLPFVLGVLVAYILAPVVAALSSVPLFGRRRLPRGASIILVYVGIAAAMALFLTAFLPHLSSDFARLVQEAPRFFQKVKREYVPRADSWLERTFPQEQGGDEVEPRPERKIVVTERHPGQYEISLEGLSLEVDPMGKGRYVVGPRSDSDEHRPRLSEFLAHAARSTETEVAGVLLVGQRFVARVLKAFAFFILTFMVAAYLLVDLERVMAFLRSLVPQARHGDFDEVMSLMDRGLSGVVRGQLIICAVNGLLTTVGLLLFHVKYSLLLGMVAGGMSFIPVFGSILSSVPIVAVALMSGGDGIQLGTGLEVLAWICGIHLIEANLLNPNIIGTAAKIHPVVVVFALMVGEETGGLIGALIAVPIASMVQVMFVYLRRRAPVL